MNKPPVRWTPHRDPYERCSSQFRVSYMSNAKWHKALVAIANAAPDLNVTRSMWKFIDTDTLYFYPVPAVYHLLPERLADGVFQPVEYKWIEWIQFPRQWRPRPNVGYQVSQDVDALKHILVVV